MRLLDAAGARPRPQDLLSFGAGAPQKGTALHAVSGVRCRAFIQAPPLSRGKRTEHNRSAFQAERLRPRDTKWPL